MDFYQRSVSISELIVAMTFTIAIFVASVDACTCWGPRRDPSFQPCEVFWGADVVFVGVVEKLSYEKSSDGRYFNKMTAHLRVEKAVRGVEEATVEVDTSPSTASCGFGFKEGERYVMYLRKNEGGRFEEGLCGPSVHISRAAADLEYIKEFEAGNTVRRIFGNVSRRTQLSPFDAVRIIGLPGVTIRLESYEVLNPSEKPSRKFASKTFQTVSDAEGFYDFRGIPPGHYYAGIAWPDKVRQIIPSSDYGIPSVTVSDAPGGCRRAHFQGTSLATVEGRVRMRGKAEIAQQHIYLIAVGVDGVPRLNDLHKTSWISPKDGRYKFETVPPGHYLIGVNPAACPSKGSSQNGQTFYPGVVDVTAARPIYVGDAEGVKVKDFYLTPERKPRDFSGVVVLSDGTAAAGAKVSLLPRGKPPCTGHDPIAQSTTDNAGRFKLRGFEGYEYEIFAAKEPPSRGRTLVARFSLPYTNTPVGDIRLVLGAN